MNTQKLDPLEDVVKDDWKSRDVPIEYMLGKTLTRAEQVGDSIIFETEDGYRFTQYHSQDCCESVNIEDICGELSDLVGSPILQAESPSSDDGPKKYGDDEYSYSDESYTWTYYRLTTIKGQVVIRWYGSSNGYYSESVDLKVERI